MNQWTLPPTELPLLSAACIADGDTSNSWPVLRIVSKSAPLEGILGYECVSPQPVSSPCGLGNPHVRLLTVALVAARTIWFRGMDIVMTPMHGIWFDNSSKAAAAAGPTLTVFWLDLIQCISADAFQLKHFCVHMCCYISIDDLLRSTHSTPFALWAGPSVVHAPLKEEPSPVHPPS